MLKPTIFTLLLKLIALFLTFFNTQPVWATASSTNTAQSPSAVDYAFNELIKAGWHKNTAQAVVTVNRAWFTILKQTYEKDFYHQIKLLKQLKNEASINWFLRKHPETAGLLALSDNPTLLVKTLDNQICYNILSGFYALHTSPTDIQMLTEALDNHRELMCQLAKHGILGSELIFLFPRNNKGAKEYDAWLKDVFSKYLWRSDEQLAEIMSFLLEKGQSIRQRLNKDDDFHKTFRKKLWPALMRVTDNNGAFELLANEPYIWDLLALKEGEVLLNKWGLGPISLLFGENGYPTDMRSIIIQILLQGDDNTVDALFTYKEEPLFRNLMRRQLSPHTQATLANKLASFCPHYPQQACPDLPDHLRYFASITDDIALAEEVGPSPSGPVTWIPFHGSYYAIKKMTQGREINSEDVLNMGLDALAFIPSALLAKPLSVSAQPLGKELIFQIGRIGLDLTPRTYHLIKPIGTFVIRTGNETGKFVTQQLAEKITQKIALLQGKKILMQNASTPLASFMTHSQQLFSQSKQKDTQPISYDITEPILLLHEKAGHKKRNAMRLMEFQTRIFMRNDAKIVMNPTCCFSDSQFFQKTAEKVVTSSETRLTKPKVSAWQQNISAWWLINAEVAY